MVPVQYLNHVRDGLAYLTDLYSTTNAPTLRALLSVYLRRVQDIENRIWQVISGRLLASNPVGDQLTHLGLLVGQPRGALNDVNLLAAVKLRILANKSNGCSEDMIGLAVALSPLWTYLDGYPMAFTVGTWDIASPDLGQSLLTKAKPGGYYGQLAYTTWADVGTDISCGSIHDSTAGESGLGSHYDTTAGGVLAATRSL